MGYAYGYNNLTSYFRCKLDLSKLYSWSLGKRWPRDLYWWILNSATLIF